MARASVVANRVAMGNAGTGFAFRSVLVMEVLSSQNICNVKDVQTGEMLQVGINKRGTDSWPQVGDQWVLNRSTAGHWLLAIKVTATTPPVVTANLDTEPDLGALLTTLAGIGLVNNEAAHQGFGWNLPGAFGSSLGSGWTTGPSSGPSLPLHFRLTRNHLQIVGTIHSTTATPAAIPFTLGPGYIPGSFHRSTASSYASSTTTARLLEISPSGVITVYPSVTATSTDLQFNIWAPMEVISP